ncbi:hypothetical protein GCM10028822_30600 [Hymenobacter terrigena]
MPDIWNRQCAEPIDLHAFAPVWLTTCFGWNRPLIYGPVPAENVSGRLQKLAEATPRTRRTPGSGASRIVAFPATGKRPISVDWDEGIPATSYWLNSWRDATGLITAKIQ